MTRLITNFSQLELKGMYRYRRGEFVYQYLQYHGVKVLKENVAAVFTKT